PLYYFIIPASTAPRSTPFPYTTLFRSCDVRMRSAPPRVIANDFLKPPIRNESFVRKQFRFDCSGPVHESKLFPNKGFVPDRRLRSEEHTSELLSRGHLVCRLLLEKKKK